MNFLAKFGSVAGLVVAASVAHAGLGDILVSKGGNVTVTIVNFTGGPGYTSKMAAETPTYTYVGTNRDFGNSVDLGPITAGEEIVLSLTNPHGDKFVTGSASANFDNVIHANVTKISSGTYRVDFEDLTGGGDFNYGDGSFEVTGVEAVPEPATMAALACGLVAVARRRKK